MRFCASPSAGGAGMPRRRPVIWHYPAGALRPGVVPLGTGAEDQTQVRQAPSPVMMSGEILSVDVIVFPKTQTGRLP